MKNKKWIVYLVQCFDKTLYCGITNNINKRIDTHNKGKGAKYTRGRLPVFLICCRGGYTKSKALKLEYKVKKQSRKKKATILLGGI